jgi:riboflavin synthase
MRRGLRAGQAVDRRKRRFGLGARLHLERALRLGDRLDGHLVAGHVDGVGRVVSLAKAQESWVLWVEAPEALSRYVAEKGSIAIDGVSLTVNEVDGARFRVNIIPYTAVETRLGLLRPGDRVNLEADLIARYLERLLAGRADAPAASLTADRLVALGFGPTRSTGRSS